MTAPKWRVDYTRDTTTCRCNHAAINHSYDRGGIRGRCLARSETCPCARFQPDEEND